MKKLLIIPLLLILGWAGFTWFIGNETESLLKTHIKDSQKNYADLGMDLKYDLTEYKKSFLSSTAKTNISLNTGDPIVDSLLKDIKFNHVISHGPVLFADGLGFGTTHIHSTLDTDTLDPEVKDILKSLFAEQNPLTSTVTMSIDGETAYTLKVPAITFKEDDIEINIAEGLNVSGSFDKDTFTGTADGTVGTFKFTDGNQTISTSASTIKVNAKGLIAGQMLGTTTLSIPSIKIEGRMMPPVSFGLNLSTNSEKSGERAVNGDLKLVASKVEAPIDITAIALDTTFKGLQIKGLKQLSELQKDLQNMQASAFDEKLSAEEQKAMVEKLQSIPTMMTAALQNTVKKDESTLAIKLDVASSKGNALLDTDISYVGNGADLNIDALSSGDIESVLKLFKGKFNLTAPKAMISTTPAALMVPLFVTKGLIAEENDAYYIKTDVTEGAVTLNGKKMTATEFLAYIDSLSDNPLGGTPEAAEDAMNDMPANGFELPPELLEELMKQDIDALEAQGLPPEMLEKIKAMKEKAPE